MSGFMKNRTVKIKGRRNRVSGDITLIYPDLLSSIKLAMQQTSPNKSFDINLTGCGNKPRDASQNQPNPSFPCKSGKKITGLYIMHRSP